jgi:hypothetical protein
MQVITPLQEKNYPTLADVINKCYKLSDSELNFDLYTKMYSEFLNGNLDINVLLERQIEDLSSLILNNKNEIEIIKEIYEEIIFASINEGAKIKASYISVSMGSYITEILIKYGEPQELLKEIFKIYSIDSIKAMQSIEFLIEAGANLSSIYYISWQNGSIKLYDYLLNNGLKPQIVLQKGINELVATNNTNLLDLALSKGGSLTGFSFSNIPSLELLENLKSKNAAPQELLNAIFKIYNNIDSIKIMQSIELLIEAGANLSNIDYIAWPDGSIKLYDYLLNNSLKPQIVLQKGINELVEKNTTNLFDFAISKGASLTDFSFTNAPSLELLEILQSRNIAPQELLNAIFKIYNNIDSIKIMQSIEFLIKSGANVRQVDYILPSFNELFHEFKDDIIKILNVDDLLFCAVHLGNINKRENDKDYSLELITYAINNGANIHQQNKGMGLLDFSKNYNVIKFLIEQGLKCSKEEMIEEINTAGLAEVFLNPAIILEQKYKNLNAHAAEIAKIPYILHHIWLTSADNPKEIREQDLKIVQNSKKIFSQSSVEWEHIVWTNNKTLIPRSIEKLEASGIKILSIYDYKNNLQLFESIESLTKSKKWGMASDTLRYSLIEHFGGVYADLNYIFKRDVTSEAHKYNYFSHTYNSIYIDNFFFAANAHHPIIQKILHMVDRNLNDPPLYISSYYNQKSSKITDMATANPTYLSYYLEANKNGNIDVIYPKIDISQIERETIVN